MKILKGLSRMEQETFFRTDAANSEWQFYSRDPKFKQLLERKGYTVTEDHQGLWAANVPLKALTLRSKRAVNAKRNSDRKPGGSLSAKSSVAVATSGVLEPETGRQVVSEIGRAQSGN